MFESVSWLDSNILWFLSLLWLEGVIFVVFVDYIEKCLKPYFQVKFIEAVTLFKSHIFIADQEDTSPKI
jgi:hypothetical protein